MGSDTGRGRALVCLKQVPRPGTVTFDERTKRVHRSADSAITNPADLWALASALALGSARGWEVVVVTMGPESARDVLLDAVGRGADRGIHLLDRRFAGADTLATARAIGRLVDRERPDLVLTGRWTLDGATAQVGPQIAELSGLSQLTQVVTLDVVDARVRATIETDTGTEDWTTALPALVSVGRGTIPPSIRTADPAAIDTITADDLGGGPRDFGTRGSPTFVVELRADGPQRSTEYIDTAAHAVRSLTGLMAATEHRAPVRHRAWRRSPTREVWAVAEFLPDATLHPTSLEAVLCGNSVATQLNASTVAVVPAHPDTATSRMLYSYGADRIMVLGHAGLVGYATGAFTDALCAALTAGSPFAVIVPFTAVGRDYAPRVAARLGLGLTGDFVGLEVRDPDSEDADLLWLKPTLDGHVVAPVIAHTTPSMGTLRPGSFPLTPVRDEDDPPVESHTPTTGLTIDTCERVARWVRAHDGPRLHSARVIVGLGSGLDTASCELATRLARSSGGAVTATSAAVAAGQAPWHIEIGPLTRAVSPALYLGVGRHDRMALDAVARAGRVVVIDPEARSDELSGRVDSVITADIDTVLTDLLAAVSMPRRDPARS